MGAPLRKSSLVVLAVLVAAALGGGVALRRVLVRPAHAVDGMPQASGASRTGTPPGELLLHVPHRPGSITLDGDTDDRGWTLPPGPARTGPFLMPDGTEARP